MLPKDARRRRDAAAADERTRPDPHLRVKELPVKVKAIPYTDDLFRNVAIEWLVSTDQVSGLCHDRSTLPMLNSTVANSGISAPSIPKNDRDCRPRDQWCQDS
jgi:hypothetical protein